VVEVFFCSVFFKVDCSIRRAYVRIMLVNSIQQRLFREFPYTLPLDPL